MTTSLPRIAASSPTAQLLRGSRLFSVPSPLPKPILEESRGYGRHATSDFASSPYPTQQVIIAPNHQRKRGEWGLKRALPVKTTRAAHGVHIHEIDTRDQVTDFSSATTQAKALLKLQELELCLTRSAKLEQASTVTKIQTSIRPNAFERDHDYTGRYAEHYTSTREPKYWLASRWRKRGPNLREMHEADFQDFLQTEIPGRAEEFVAMLKSNALRQFVKGLVSKTQFLVQKDKYDEQKAEWLYYTWLDRFSDQELSAYVESLKNRSEFPSEHVLQNVGMFEREEVQKSFSHYIDQIRQGQQQEEATALEQLPGIDAIVKDVVDIEKQLYSSFEQYWHYAADNFRKNSGSERRFVKLIEQFLDLPPTLLSAENAGTVDLQPKSSFGSYTSIFDTSQVTLSTHPSAGLSYHRSANVLANHPIFGPLKGGVPHRGRVLINRHQPDTVIRDGGSSWGLGGVAVATKDSMNRPDLVRITDEHGQQEGENQTRSWLVVDDAEIRPDGRIKIVVKKATDSAKSVAENELFETMEEEERRIEAERLFEEQQELNGTSYKAKSEPSLRRSRVGDLTDPDAIDF